MHIYNYYTYAYQDIPAVEITTATGGCGYVYVSWTVLGNNDICEITTFHLTLVSLVMGKPMGPTTQKSTDMYSYNFTGLPDDTQFDISVIGSSAVVNTDLVSVHVRTMDSESMNVLHELICVLYLYVC